MACCHNKCTALDTDTNCLTCGDACTLPDHCTSSGCYSDKCEGKHGGTACDGSWQTCCSHKCVDLNTNKDNCGICGKACKEGLSCCRGSCVDKTKSPNCGKCGNDCEPDGTCINGVCTYDGYYGG
ncbi:MAG: hypothetical protein HQL15_02470 [Candidatus Omnitrophica bacterium]|nr:hypothetical protein [Candidatus Omnitrophota bacterium]